MKKIIIDKLSKRFRIGFHKNQGALARFISLFSGREPKKTITALDELSFTAESGEIVGIIGKNGSGKSTLLRVIAGIYQKDSGRIDISGNIISLIGLGSGMKERLMMEENIFVVGSFFGLSRKAIRGRFNSIVEFAGLEGFVKTKLYQFSSGMLQRLAFSIAIHCDPEILLLDEVFAVGDENFRHKSTEKIKEIVENGATAILASHALGIIEKYCNRVIWIEKGRIVKEGIPKEILDEYAPAP